MDNARLYINIVGNIEEKIIREIESYLNVESTYGYLLTKPLTIQSEDYNSMKSSAILLIPGHKLIFLNFAENNNEMEDYEEYILDDLSSLSKKHDYEQNIGRIIRNFSSLRGIINVKDETDIVNEIKHLYVDDKPFVTDALISLAVGSFNDISNKIEINRDSDELTLIKNNITIYDADQAKFLFESSDQKVITVQGLAGSGKTELLLHKLRNIYTSEDDVKVAMVCHNKVLARTLKSRIPKFFDIMKVEKQIEWDEKLWCMHAWGSSYSNNMGLYSHVCDVYDLKYYSYGDNRDFEDVCKKAVEKLSSIVDLKECFDYLLIDESQDFGEEFINLCKLITRKKVIVAGDIFQTIYDSDQEMVNPDYLLNKVYRTNAKTFTLAHLFSMGLYSKPVKWLDNDQFERCGYKLTDNENETITLTREPLRRFRDVDEKKWFDVHEVDSRKIEDYAKKVYENIDRIKRENEKVTAADIGIVILAWAPTVNQLANELQKNIFDETGFNPNLGHITQKIVDDTIFITNKNNVKGLEFPFVICVVDESIPAYFKYRKNFYMIFTRSFISTDLIIINNSSKNNEREIKGLRDCINELNKNDSVTLKVPTQEEQLSFGDLEIGAPSRRSVNEVVLEVSSSRGFPQKYMDILQTNVEKRLYELDSEDILYELDDVVNEELDEIINEFQKVI